jgi:acylglycerol lipase
MTMQLNINNIKHSGLVLVFTGISFLFGCSAPKTQLPSGISQTPKLERNQFISDDGYRLPITRYWPHSPEYAAPKGIVIALHGFNDYSKAFEGMCQYFVSRDMACVAYDQRGFGDTEMVGIWPQVGRLQKDLHAIIELLHQQNPELPIFLVGESMGGAVILTAISDSSLILDKGVQGAILYAPAVWARSTQPWYQKFVLWVLVHTFPDWTPTGMNLDIQATDNIAALRAMGQDDKIIKATRIDTIYGLIDLMDAALLASKDVSINTLVLYGEKDEIIPKAPTCEMLQQMRSIDQNVRFKHYPDGYHMLTRDLQANRVFADSLMWMSDFQLENQREKMLGIDQFQSEKLSKENTIRYCEEW